LRELGRREGREGKWGGGSRKKGDLLSLLESGADRTKRGGGEKGEGLTTAGHSLVEKL